MGGPSFPSMSMSQNSSDGDTEESEPGAGTQGYESAQPLCSSGLLPFSLFLCCPTAGPGLFSRCPREALLPPPFFCVLAEGNQRSEFFILFFFDSCSSIYRAIFLSGVDFFFF